MRINLPEDATVLFHPIVFFDQGTYFFETRRRLDGAALFRCGQVDRPVGADGDSAQTSILIIDPLEPLRRMEAEVTLLRRPAGWECNIHCTSLEPGGWGLLAALGADEMRRVRMATVPIPDRPVEFNADEWLLRHAFADDRVRDNSFLAATLARLPMVFARAGAGTIAFTFPAISDPQHLVVVATNTPHHEA